MGRIIHCNQVPGKHYKGGIENNWWMEPAGTGNRGSKQFPLTSAKIRLWSDQRFLPAETTRKTSKGEIGRSAFCRGISPPPLYAPCHVTIARQKRLQCSEGNQKRSKVEVSILVLPANRGGGGKLCSLKASIRFSVQALPGFSEVPEPWQAARIWRSPTLGRSRVESHPLPPPWSNTRCGKRSREGTGQEGLGHPTG